MTARDTIGGGPDRIRRVGERLLYSRLGGRVVLYPVSYWGYRRFRRTGETPPLAYRAMRKLFGDANPSLFERLRTMAEQHRAPLTFDEPPGGIASSEIDETVVALQRDGCAVLGARLDEDLCAALEACARLSTCSLVPSPDLPPFRDRFRDDAPRAVRYDLDEADIIRSPAAQQIVADPSLLAIAQRYLGGPPVQDLLAMWWSAAVRVSSASSAAAQEFHFDLDRLSFLKVFVYLTDVDERSGPHVYIRGTHRNLPARFRADRRYRDAEVLSRFDGHAMTIAGPRGTVFLADTRGLHKGQTLLDGNRLVFQIEYATSLFGHPYARQAVVSPTADFSAMHDRYEFTFQRFALVRT